jgi:hypothetical protein
VRSSEGTSDVLIGYVEGERIAFHVIQPYNIADFQSSEFPCRNPGPPQLDLH